jgi:eukaryotic-like serine/threonine-protein kinase
VLEGAYCITRVIGRGSMSTVYEGMQLRLGKRMAIKVLSADKTADERVMARFHREAEITSQLGHPNLVSVVDRGRAETGEPYLVMEFLEGEDLDQRLARVGRMPIEDVVRVVMQAASALSAAHAQGVVHRDLKPANIFLVRVAGEPDFVKVLDFGVSKLIAARTRLTKPSTAVGTPHYMAPEQASGMVDSIDHRIDQWALACIAWEMLLGMRPFVATDPTEVLYQVVMTEPPPLTPHVPGLPPEVETVLRRALRKRAESRFDSIRDFSHAFAAAALGQPIEVTPELGDVVPAPAASSVSGVRAAVTEAPHSVSPSPRPSTGGSARVAPRSRRLRGALAVAVVVSGLLLLGGLWWFRSTAASSADPTPARPPVAAPVVDTEAAPTLLPTIEATPAEPASAEPEPARPKRPKAAKKPAKPSFEGKRPLFDRL